MQSNLESVQSHCPHSHKASLILENSDISDGFLSKHYESCNSCRTKLESLKQERSALKRQIPFATAPKEIRDIFQEESREFTLRVKKRVTLLKKKRVNEVRAGVMMFLKDIKTAFLSKQFLFSITLVGGTWAYYNLLN
ncbi:hypothetical protein [Halobacteriovorax sp. HLS]|uniref:hypothetical protein n=1 Tax=Halobacteriovorax sp. HLS TaxID=2234000 RepID=UPI000FD83603|nr:hypothetical protein [Halobacteriovorax sp. HLS]